MSVFKTLKTNIKNLIHRFVNKYSAGSILERANYRREHERI